MQIILASAKIMNSSATAQLSLATEPRFQTYAERFALELGQLSPEELAQRLKCNAKLALENKLRYQDFFNEEHRIPAIMTYYGQAYKCLKAQTLSPSALTFASHHLWILSFLYGMLRPTDRIHPYRLEGKMALEAAGGKTMFAFWKPLLTDILIDAVKADDGTLVHLATEEFEHLFDWKRIMKELHVVQPHFYVQKGDQLKNVTVYAKSCRGAMTRFILQNGIERPEDLLAFEYEGFSVSPHSTIPPDSKAGLTELLWTLEA